MELNQANRLLEPGHLALETGIERLADGQLMVAILTPMQNVTVAMLRHWYLTLTGTARYKLWHPKDHVSFETVGTPGVAEDGRWVHNLHIQEYIGGALHKLRIQGRDSGDILDKSRLADAGIAICRYSRFGPLDREGVWDGHILHLTRETGYGVEIRTRIWLGDIEPDPQPAEILQELYPDSFGLAFLKHCSEEMSYLARILPDLYRREAGAGAND